MSRPVIFLMGPTASGKTDLAVDLVARLNCEIISVDSAMVYRGLDIGTAKPDSQTLARAPHHLIDIRDPADPYSAAAFAEDAERHIDEIHARGAVPLLVGGTMLYFRALEQGLSPLPQADPEVRAEITREAERIGWPALHARLAESDPESARKIHPNDSQRIQRALEIQALSGQVRSAQFGRRRVGARKWDIVRLIIAPQERAVLHARIRQRLDWMMAQGFPAEVEKLHSRPDLTDTLPAIRAVGYRQLWRHFEGDWTLAEAAERAVIATRQLARRQLTWLRAEQSDCWLDSLDENRTNLAVRTVEHRLGPGVRRHPA